MAAAPSFTPEELPAVTVPPATEGRFKLAQLLQRGLRPGMLVV